MIDKTMCEVLGRNISDIYVNLRVEVGKFYVRFLKIFYSETTGKFTLAMYTDWMTDLKHTDSAL
jgi:hypothetical protein